MSTLTTAVEARYSTERLAQLTNKDSRAATTVNATVLATAAADATVEFAIQTGETLDDTDAFHIRLATELVVAFLIQYKGQDNSWQIMKDAQRSCTTYRLTRANARIQPLTDRTLGPTQDVNADGTPRRPEFDRARFNRLDVAPPNDAEPWVHE
jgi:hypothetical protein